MNKLGAMSLGLALAMGACGGGGGGSDAGAGGDSAGCYVQDTTGFNCATNGGDDCVIYPSEAVMAVDGDALVAPDFSCLPEADMTFAAAATVSGKVLDFQNNGNLANATVSVFDDFAFDGAPIASATTNGEGDYSLTLPTGTPARTHWLMEHDDALPTIGLFLGLDVAQTTVTGANRRSVSTLTANALPAFIGHARSPGLGVVAGSMEDCLGRPLTHAIGVVSSTASAAAGTVASSTPVDGAEIYFFGATGLPTRRNMRNDSNLDGSFVAIEAPVAAMVYLQAWGYLTAADACTGPTALKLISELPSPSIGDTVISANLYPTQGPL